jgi:hypothetical protein
MKGMGVMINELFGNRKSSEIIKTAIGKTIHEVKFHGDAIHFEMADGQRFRIEDDGQSCCEHRYMKCDDDLAHFAGATFLGAEVRDAPSIEDGCESHEVAFLIVKTSQGEFTANTHNEHNGYYGGFYICAKSEQPTQPKER